jgi:hypothetical protein
MKPRDIQKDTDLHAVAGYVTYEIETLAFASEHLGGWHSSPKASPEDSEKNVALESFLLHFRNLRAFLCPLLQTDPQKEPPRVKPDDVIASDFLRESTARNVVSPDPFLADKERIDKMLAHISYQRTRYITTGQDGWAVAKMLELMLEQFEVFLKPLPATERSWFPAAEWLAECRMRAVDDASTLPSMTVTGSRGVDGKGGSSPLSTRTVATTGSTSQPTISGGLVNKK